MWMAPGHSSHCPEAVGGGGHVGVSVSSLSGHTLCDPGQHLCLRSVDGSSCSVNLVILMG